MFAPAVFAGNIQPVQAMQDAVVSYVKSSLGAEGQFEIEAGQIDSRLQLPLCDQELQIFPQSGELKPGRNTIAIRCKGNQVWMVYTNVTVKSYKKVLLLNRALRRNEKIRTEDLVSETREVGSLSQGYIVDPAEAVNKQATRNLAAGAVLNSLSLTDPTLVKRGDQVNIQLGNAGMSISSAGVAMMDGAKGERINVRNASSHRIIQAVVIQPGQVSVSY